MPPETDALLVEGSDDVGSHGQGRLDSQSVELQQVSSHRPHRSQMGKELSLDEATRQHHRTLSTHDKHVPFINFATATTYVVVLALVSRIVLSAWASATFATAGQTVTDSDNSVDLSSAE